jgi:hypothetical protein
LTIQLQTIGRCINVTDEGSPISISADEQLPDDTPSFSPTDHQIVRSQGDLTDRYHGPCTLFALCNEFCNAALLGQQGPPTEDEAQQSRKEDSTTKIEVVRDVLARMCLEASTEEPFNPQSEYMPIRLPPKEILLIVQTYFFQWVGYETDVFVQSRFWSNTERIHSQPFTPDNEVWAICFNTIILLVLGSGGLTQGNDPLVGPQFSLHFLSTVRTALSNYCVLMVPKLINVQTLALLVSTPGCNRIGCSAATMITNSY